MITCDKKLLAWFWRSLLCFIICFSSASFALDENFKQWFAVNAQQRHGQDQKWRTYLYSQLRIIDKQHFWQTLFLEGAFGYDVTAENSLWLGYRFSGHDFSNDFFVENRLFQQLIWQKNIFDSSEQLGLRSRLEELSHSNINEIAVRLRERLGIKINDFALFAKTFPYLYDEIFFQFNHPKYMPHTFIGENRLFIGVNVYLSKQKWWEIGYINQYQTHTPQGSENQMNHILSITYNCS